MTDTNAIERIRLELLTLREETEQRRHDIAEEFDAMVEAVNDVAVDDEHDPEGHTIAWERQQVAARLPQTDLAIERIDEALERLADGTYGMCTSCGDAIGVERLEALPATPLCLECARSEPG